MKGVDDVPYQMEHWLLDAPLGVHTPKAARATTPTMSYRVRVNPNPVTHCRGCSSSCLRGMDPQGSVKEPMFHLIRHVIDPLHDILRRSIDSLPSG